MLCQDGKTSRLDHVRCLMLAWDKRYMYSTYVSLLGLNKEGAAFTDSTRVMVQGAQEIDSEVDRLLTTDELKGIDLIHGNFIRPSSGYRRDATSSHLVANAYAGANDDEPGQRYPMGPLRCASGRLTHPDGTLTDSSRN